VENQVASTEELDSADLAEVDFISQIRPRVSSIVKAPTPVSPNPQHPGTHYFEGFSKTLQLILSSKDVSAIAGENHVELRRPLSVPGNESTFRRRHYSSGSDFARLREHRTTSAAESNDCFQMLR
jgi:hypothetical protein